MHDPLRVNLIQTQQQVSRNDLDVAKVKGFAPRDQIFKKVGWPGRYRKLFFLLDLTQHAVVLHLAVASFKFNLLEE